MSVSIGGEVLTCVLHADFQISIFADPIYRGDWPASVKERVPPNLLRIAPDLARPPTQLRAPLQWCNSLLRQWACLHQCLLLQYNTSHHIFLLSDTMRGPVQVCHTRLCSIRA